jgi:hypothetical protein
MTQYLVAIHHPDGYDPAVAENEAMSRDISALNKEMIAAGVRVFAGGLKPAGSARSLRALPDGGVLITDGPYLEAKEHLAGWLIVETATIERAVEIAQSWPDAQYAAMEVRPIMHTSGLEM